MLIASSEGERLYFVVETKGKDSELRESEQDKIECGKRHFEAIATALGLPGYTVASDLTQVLAAIE